MLLEINLLPWRTQARIKSKLNFLLCVMISACVPIVFLCVAHFILNYYLMKQEKRINTLQTKLSLLEDRPQKIKIQNQQREMFQIASRMTERIQNNQHQILNIFHKLTTKMPKEIYLSEMICLGAQVDLSGVSRSVIALSELTQNLNGNLTEIKQLSDHSELKFKFHFAQNLLSVFS